MDERRLRNKKTLTFQPETHKTNCIMKTINFSKKIAIVFSLLISCLHGIGQETDPLMSNFFIYATGATGKAGSTAELTLNMHNIEPICAWTCNLVLPEGVTFQSVALIKDRQPEGYEAEPVATCQEDGSVTITCEGTKDIGLTGTDGAIASVMVEIADTITSGRHIVGVRDAFFVVVDELGFYEKAYTEFKWFIKGNDLPLVEEGKVWSYKGSRLIAPTDVQAEWNEIYSLEGDTVIDARRCMKLYVTSDSPSESHDHSYLGAMYEEGECVYYIASGSTTPSLLYDFSCEPGNTVKVNQFELAINERKIVKYRGKYLTVIDWSPIEEGEETFYHNIWIEGIGSPLDLLNDTPIWYDGCPYKELVTCKLNDQVIYDKNDFEASAQPVPKEETSQEFFPEGTRWTEIRLDTLEHSSWYSKIDGEWVPNFETIEYYVQGEYVDKNGSIYKCVYTNGPEWTDSLTILLDERGYNKSISATAQITDDGVTYTLCPGQTYQFDWNVGQTLSFRTIEGANTTCFPPCGWYNYGLIEEIKEGDFGGVSPLKYVDLDGKAPVNPEAPWYTDTNGARIIQGIGVTEWDDGECLFGPSNPYYALMCFDPDGWYKYPWRNYRSMLVHFERGGEVLYDVWPRKGSTAIVTIDGVYYFLYLNSHEAVLTSGRNDCSGELDIPSEVSYNDETFTVKSMTHSAFHCNSELTKVKIPKSIESIRHSYPYDPDDEDAPTGMVSPDHMNPFCGCSALESIEVDEENPSMKSVDGVLFSKDGTRLYCYPIGKQQKVYTIPDAVEWIGASAFEGSQNLTTLTIPSGVTYIGECAFADCNNFTDVYCYAENVPSTGSTAFGDTPTFFGYQLPIASATLHVPAGSVDKYKTTYPWSDFGNIVALPEPVSFTEGQMATIILPTEPDASKGKYYRLDRVEDRQIIFEQELQPQAHIPYIIVPSEDFSIDPSNMDLEGLSCDTASIGDVSFIGSYVSKELDQQEGLCIQIIDTTPDCSISFSEETGKETFLIGALRAYLTWDDPYNQGGTKGRGDKLEIVLRDYGTSIEEIKNEELRMKNDVFDLSGRKIVNGQLQRGIYIENGRKKTAK